MTRRIVLSFVLLIGLAIPSCGGAQPPKLPRFRVHVLALDGADRDIIRGLIAARQLPNFERAIAAGAFGGLRSEHPRLRDLVWTSVATGRPAKEHGVREFVLVDRKERRMRPLASFMRRTETVWEIASANNLRVGVVGWPGTWPPDPVNGTLVPDRFGTDAPAGEQTVHPPDAAAGLARYRRDRANLTTAAVRRFILPKGGGPREEAFLTALAVDQTRRAIANDLVAGSVDVLITWSGLLGTTSHLFMGMASPKLDRVSTEDFERYGQAVVGAYRYADELVGEAMARLDGNTTLLVVSPYGFRHGIQRLRTDPMPNASNASSQHRPSGFLLAVGAGVHAGASLEGARVSDVLPTVLGLLGCPRAEDMGGRFLSEGFSVEPPDATVPTWERGRYERQLTDLLGESEGAEEVLDEFPTLAYIGSATALSNPASRALIEMVRKKHTAALRIVEPASKLAPDDVVLHGLLAELSRSFNKLDRAEEEYREAIRLAPDELVYRVGLARVLMDLERLAEAEQVLEDASRIEPTDASIHRVRASLLADAGRKRDAVAALTRAVELEPESIVAQSRLGALLVELGDLDAAATRLRQALELDPGSRSLWNNLCVALVRRTGETGLDRVTRGAARATARVTVDEAIRRFPDYAVLWHNRAVLNRLMGRKDAALADARRALSIDPEHEGARKLVRDLE